MDQYESPLVIASFGSQALLGEALASLGGSCTSPD
jgi:hypothetical protein